MQQASSEIAGNAWRRSLTEEVEVVIVGAGLAGLFTALRLAPMPVSVLSPAPIGRGASSAWAQGGIAAAVGEGDTPAKHARDTFAAGAGLVDPHVAQITAEEAPDRIADLLGYGVPFDKDLEGALRLSREAAHSERRIVRVEGDRAGRAIMAALIAAVHETPSIRLVENIKARRLLCHGSEVTAVEVAPTREGREGESRFIPARAVVLTTGGLGQIYAVTTNPVQARGEGLAMAARAGAVVADAEFVQFHPTALNTGQDPAPLATEALRGEGAVLVNARGERFMPTAHPDAELAPRDVVARAVHREIAAGRGAFLDCRAAIGARIATDFPTVYGKCREAGIDPATAPIPVTPAAHYHMGGLLTDIRGRTSLDGLWACGEVASTGLHGANRLASNSLLEAVVFGERIARDISGLMRVRRHTLIDMPGFPEPEREGARTSAGDMAGITRLRKTMSEFSGVVRSRDGLEQALMTITDLQEGAAKDGILSDMLVAAKFVTVAALRREESRGGHFRSDFPCQDPALAARNFFALGDVDAAGCEVAASGPQAAYDNVRALRP